ncbi:MAG: EamA family transporter [Bacteroidales bacterium]|jgi:transporter family protein|nr:EamA family transporter [Bacteroidales bacterium]
MWIVYVIFSALLLGVYDVFKKVSVTENAVLPVLFISSLVQLLIFSPLIVASHYQIGFSPGHLIYIPFTGLHTQILIFLKTCLVMASWVCSFFALKNLPISIVGPIRSTSPVWTLFGAIFLLGERLTMVQWIGIAVVFASIYSYSFIGKREGIVFAKNKWIILVFLATLFGAASALYDKYLIAELGIHRMEVQAWFSIYQSFILLPFVYILWWPKRRTFPFSWKWSIPCIGVFLILSDFFFFYALSQEGALISIISLVRRSSIVISFLSGLFLFKERYILPKGIALIGVIFGVVLLYLA